MNMVVMFLQRFEDLILQKTSPFNNKYHILPTKRHYKPIRKTIATKLLIYHSKCVANTPTATLLPTLCGGLIICMRSIVIIIYDYTQANILKVNFIAWRL